jgi:hypothetical protein
MIEVLQGDCREVMAAMEAGSFDAVVTDPPYGLSSGQSATTGFMGQAWDARVPGPEYWEAVLRIAKPGAHLVAFGGTRTFHRLAVALEDAGWEIRDTLCWLHGQGFPKSLDVSKALDAEELHGGSNSRRIKQANDGRTGEGRERGRCKNNGIMGEVRESRSPIKDEASTDLAREWSGWGTALKPGWESIILARKPLIGTVAQNVTAHRCGALNIDGCRIGTVRHTDLGATQRQSVQSSFGSKRGHEQPMYNASGRFPANVVLSCDCEAECEPGCPLRMLDEQSGQTTTGGASRFFYTAKAGRAERGEGNTHPTVKPLALMEWLILLVTPPGGRILDPFAGSCTTLLSAQRLDFDAVGIELDPHWCEVARKRIADEQGLFAEAR